MALGERQDEVIAVEGLHCRIVGAGTGDPNCCAAPAGVALLPAPAGEYLRKILMILSL
jgi:hypothetical protein